MTTLPGLWTAMAQFVVALGVIIAVAQALARVARRLGQPSVAGEVVAGILLGPSLLGALAPAVSAAIFPLTVMPLLRVYAEIGVVLYMFFVGAKLETDILFARRWDTVVISIAGIVVPTVLGVGLAAALASSFSPPGVPFPIFASFLGLSLSVTALAVLARMLGDWQLTTSPIGAQALASAAVSDATVLSLLAVLVGFSRARGGEGLRTALLAVGFVVIMIGVVAQSLAWLARRFAGRATLVASVVLVGLFASALTAEWIGIEALLGALLFGAILPRQAHLPAPAARWVERAVSVAFLPAFFALTGLRTEIGLLADVYAWLVCAAVVVVATVGKVGGTWLASRLVGLGARESLALGILMNTRGLVELVVLNMGLELGILTPPLFTILVVMALVTTFAIPPVWKLVTRYGPLAVPGQPEHRRARG